MTGLTPVIPGALCKSTRGRDRFCGKIFTKTSRFYLWERELLDLHRLGGQTQDHRFAAMGQMIPMMAQAALEVAEKGQL